MAELGTVLQKHSRNYVYLNPNVYQGPNTWRLSNQSTGVDYDCIQNIWGIAPIVKAQIDADVILKFDISSIPKTVHEVNTSEVRLSEAAEAVMNSQPAGGFLNCAFDEIESELPVDSLEANKDVTVWFEIINLESIDSTRAVNGVSDASGYNRSVATLVAQEPLYVDVAARKANISFDMSNLDPV